MQVPVRRNLHTKITYLNEVVLSPVLRIISKPLGSDYSYMEALPILFINLSALFNYSVSE
jgi:hypothetical protein